MRVNPGSRAAAPARRTVLLGLGAVGLAAAAGCGPSRPDAAKTPPAPQWGRTPTQADEILLEHPGAVVSCLAFSPDGSVLAIGRKDHRVLLWDVAAGKPKGAPLETDQPVMSVAFSPDGEILAAGGGDQVVLWDAPLRAPRARALAERRQHVRPLAFSPDGRFLAVVGADGAVRFFDPATGARSGAPLDAASLPNAVAFSPDGAILATGGDAGVRIFDTASRRELARLDTPACEGVAFSPDGRSLAVDGDTQVLVLGVPDGRVIRSFAAEGVYRSLAFSLDGRSLAVGYLHGRPMRLWDPATGKPIGEPFPARPEAIVTVAFSPDGTLLAAGGEIGLGPADGNGLFDDYGGAVSLWRP